VAGDEFAVRILLLLGEHLHGREIFAQAGTVELVRLLVEVALGDEDAAVALAQFGQRLSNAREKLDLLRGDGLCEGDDAGVFFRGDFGIGELLEAGDKRAAEALETVTVFGDRCVFAEVEPLADLFVGMDAVIQIGDESGDGALEVDIVLPERVVRVEEKGLLL